MHSTPSVHVSRIVLPAACAIGVTASIVLASHIDFFDAGPFELTVGAGETDSAVQNVPTGASGAIGGQRFVTLTSTSTPPLGGGMSAVLQVDDPDKNDNSVFLTAMPGVTSGGSMQLEYGAGTALEADFVGIPGMNADWDRIVVDYLSLDDYGGAMTVTLTTGNGATSAITRSIEAGAHRLEILYSEFFCDAPTLDLGDVDYVSLELSLPGELNDEQTVAIGFFGRGGFVEEACPEDVDGDGAVGFQDILRILSAWGPCESP